MPRPLLLTATIPGIGTAMNLVPVKHAIVPGVPVPRPAPLRRDRHRTVPAVRFIPAGPVPSGVTSRAGGGVH